MELIQTDILKNWYKKDRFPHGLIQQKLESLSRRELQKQCKKQKLNKHGEDRHLRSRILRKMQSKYEEKYRKYINKIDIESTLKHQEAKRLIVTNYLDGIDIDVDIPNELITVISSYTDKILIIFDSFPNNFKEQNQLIFSNENRFITRLRIQTVPPWLAKRKLVTARFLIGCSKGFKTGENNEWKIKLLSENCVKDSFGIISNISLCKEEIVWFRDGERRLANIKFNKYYQSGKALGLKENDIVCIQLNFNQCKLSYFVNKEPVTQIQFEPDQTYYPIIWSKSNHTKYKIVY